MNEDLINQLTLNCLISKTQLSKLNKHKKDSIEDLQKINDKQFYKKRIEELFNKLYENDKPEDLLNDVETGFNYFVDRAIYYLKVIDANEELEKERSGNISEKEVEKKVVFSEDNEDTDDPEDYYNDDKPDYFSEEHSDVGNASEDEETKELVNKQFELLYSIDKVEIQKNQEKLEVNKRHKKNIFSSEGVENIDDLNNNWFEMSRRNIKQHTIIPRIAPNNENKEEIEEIKEFKDNNNFNEKKNIPLLYENKKKYKK